MLPALRGHARTARGLHEIGGRLVVVDRGNRLDPRIERYIAGKNLEAEPGWFSDDDSAYPPAPPGSQLVVVHSHPGSDEGGTTRPSRGDLESCFEYGDELLGIYAPRWDRLAVWRVLDECTYQRVPLFVEGTTRVRAARPGRRR